MRAFLASLAVALPLAAAAHPCEQQVQAQRQQVASLGEHAQGAGLVGMFDKKAAGYAQNQQAAYQQALANLQQSEANCSHLVYQEQQAAEARRAEERRAAEQRRLEEQRLAAQREAEQRAAEQRAAELRAAEQRAAEQRAAQQLAVNDSRASTRRAPAVRAGCAKDTECKGDRICVKGACVDPKTRQ